MSHCPNCQSAVEEDFGLIACSACGSMLLIELDGSVQVYKDVRKEERDLHVEFVDREGGGDSLAPPSENFAQGEAEGSPSPHEGVELFSEGLDRKGLSGEEKIHKSQEFHEESEWEEASASTEPSLWRSSQGAFQGLEDPDSQGVELEEEILDGASLSLSEERGVAGEGGEVLTSQEVREGAVPSPLMAESVKDTHTEAILEVVSPESESQYAESDWGVTQPMEEPQVAEPASSEAATGFSDVRDYGNSDISGAHEGMLRFNVYISGIDNSELLSFVQESLIDEKFMWEVDEVMEKIQNGKLVLRNMSPVKASIVVSRLKILPLEICWEQYAIHQS